MSDKMRKLLPYEYQLIDAIGISKEEYLDFVCKQHIYNDPKEGTVLDARNWEAVAITLSIIGILSQVAAVLLAPKPPAPPAAPSAPGALRDQKFAPTFGFESAQELAAYGDPINLIYTNNATNPDGGVRVATSLIWSAVQSYGNSQLAQLLFVLGAGGIGEINQKKSAFGQTPLIDIIAQNQWTYFKTNYTGALTKSALLPDPFGLLKPAEDPTTTKINNEENLYRIKTSKEGGLADGFSHAYSPSSSNSFGVYAPVPINIFYFVKANEQSFAKAENKITMNNWSGALQQVNVDQDFTVTIAAATTKGNVAVVEASEVRETTVSVFDNAGTFKFGASKLKVVKLDKSDIISGPMNIALKCIEAGKGSSVAYGARQVSEVVPDIPTEKPGEYASVSRISARLLAIDDRLIENEQLVLPDAAGADARQINARELAEYGNLYDLIKKTVVGANKVKKIEFSYKFIRNLTADEKQILVRYADLTDLRNKNYQDNFFYSKALTRIEEAAYETVSPCNIVDFSIKARVFKRVSGRTSSKENGSKMRTSMFLVKYKKTSDGEYNYFPGVFVVRRSSDIDNYIYLRFNSGTAGVANASNWQFKFEPVVDVRAELATKPGIKYNNQVTYYYLENSGEAISRTIPGTSHSFEFVGQARTPVAFDFPPLNRTPQDMNEWDLFANRSNTQVQFSFESGPEFSLAVVTEQIVDPFSNYDKLYQDIALIGLNIYSGKSIRDLRSFTIFVNKGRKGKSLPTSGNGWGSASFDYFGQSTDDFINTAPDIFLDTVLDKNDGIGQYATLKSVNLEKLAKSKKFCQQNKLFMDGVIADATSWRSFWAENSGFSLLELAKLGGQDALIPAVPANENTGVIDPNIAITALFNAGNILEDSLKEELIDYGANTQDIVVSAIYRQIVKDGTFERKSSVDVRLKDVVEANALRQTIDMSNFVTRREQAILVAKFLCLTKRHSQRSIEFRTFPTDSPVFPGAYIYVETNQNQWDPYGIYSGSIEKDGLLNTSVSTPIPSVHTNTNTPIQYSALVYKPGGGTAGTKSLENITINAAQVASALAGYEGSLFVLGQNIKNKRVYRVTEVQMDEEGEVTIRGIEHATNGSGQSLLALNLLASGLFQIDGQVV